VHVLDKLLDGLREDTTFRRRKGAMVASEVLDSLSALCLLKVAIKRLERGHPGETRGSVYEPVAAVLEVI